MKKRILSILLTLVMVIGMLPTVAFAAGTGGGFTAASSSDDWNFRIDEDGMLTWNSKGDTGKYNIEVWEERRDGGHVFDVVDVSETSYDLKATFEAKRLETRHYYVRVSTRESGNLIQSEWIYTFYISVQPQLAEPQNLQWDALGNQKWEPVAGATGYIFRLYDDEGNLNTKTTTTKTEATQWAEDGWFFTVQATADGYRNSSVAASPKYGTGAIGGFTAASSSDDWNLRIDEDGMLTWNSKGDTGKYNIEVWEERRDGGHVFDVVDVSETSYDLKATFEAKRLETRHYYVRVSTRESGNLIQSEWIYTFYISVQPQLAEPQNLQWDALGNQKWEPVAGATGYIFRLYDDEGNLNTKTTTTKTEATQWAEDGWFFTVQATADGYRNSSVAASPKYFRGTVNVGATWSGTPADATTSTTGAEVIDTKWYKKNDSSWTELTSSNTISAGGTYRCEVTVAAAAGYQLIDGYTVKINGTAATKKSGNTWYRDVTITGISDYVEVNDIDLPEAFTNPDFTYDTSDVAPSRKHWDVAKVEWFECDKDGHILSGALTENDVFKKDTYYRVEVTVVPETNWQFHGSQLSVYINGKAAMPLYGYNKAYPDSVTGYLVYNTADMEGDYELFVYDDSLSGSAKNIYIKDGQYLGSDATAPSDTKPSGGYAYYEDGVLTLNGYDNEKAHFYFEELALELWLVGDNTIGAIYDNQWGHASNLEVRQGNLVIDAADGGKLTIASNPLDAYANIQVKDLYFNGGELTSCLANGTYGASIALNDGNLYLENGYVAYVSDTNDFAAATKWDGTTDISDYDCVWIVKEKTETTLTGSATDGIKVKVEKLSGSATLIVAQYEGGKMVDVQTMTVSADGTYPMDQLTLKDGCTYKAFLVNSTTYAPLCTADDF